MNGGLHSPPPRIPFENYRKVDLRMPACMKNDETSLKIQRIDIGNVMKSNALIFMASHTIETIAIQRGCWINIAE